MKTTIMIDLTDEEVAALDDLCEAQDLSRENLLRHGLRIYQLIHKRNLWEQLQRICDPGLPPKSAPLTDSERS